MFLVQRRKGLILLVLFRFKSIFVVHLPIKQIFWIEKQLLAPLSRIGYHIFYSVLISIPKLSKVKIAFLELVSFFIFIFIKAERFMHWNFYRISYSIDFFYFSKAIFALRVCKKDLNLKCWSRWILKKVKRKSNQAFRPPLKPN